MKMRMLIGSLLVAVLLAGGCSKQNEEREEQALACEKKVKAIIEAAHTYAAESMMQIHPQGKVPTLRDLAPYLSYTTKCPGSPKPDRAIDYVYVAQDITDMDTSPEALMVCCFGDCHAGEFRVVGRVNGEVERLTPEAFAAELAKPANAEFATALDVAEAQARQQGSD